MFVLLPPGCADVPHTSVCRLYFAAKRRPVLHFVCAARSLKMNGLSSSHARAARASGDGLALVGTAGQRTSATTTTTPQTLVLA